MLSLERSFLPRDFFFFFLQKVSSRLDVLMFSLVKRATNEASVYRNCVYMTPDGVSSMVQVYTVVMLNAIWFKNAFRCHKMLVCERFTCAAFHT